MICDSVILIWLQINSMTHCWFSKCIVVQLYVSVGVVVVKDGAGFKSEHWLPTINSLANCLKMNGMSLQNSTLMKLKIMEMISRMKVCIVFLYVSSFLFFFLFMALSTQWTLTGNPNLTSIFLRLLSCSKKVWYDFSDMFLLISTTWWWRFFACRRLLFCADTDEEQHNMDMVGLRDLFQPLQNAESLDLNSFLPSHIDSFPEKWFQPLFPGSPNTVFTALLCIQLVISTHHLTEVCLALCSFAYLSRLFDFPCSVFSLLLFFFLFLPSLPSLHAVSQWSLSFSVSI